MLEKLFVSVFGLNWFRRTIVVSIVLLTIKLTEWGMAYAHSALQAHADLVGTAGIVTAVSGIPLTMLTLVFNFYRQQRQQDADPSSKPDC